MPAGRPTKLTPEAIETAKDYINGGYQAAHHTIPSVVGLARVLNVGKSTLYRWAEEDKGGFRDILEECNDQQHEILISEGLAGNFNPTICKLVLGKHGYHERQEVSGPDGEKLQINIVRHGEKD